MKKRSTGITLPLLGQRFPAEERQVILNLIAEAKAAGLPAERACAILGLSPRTLQHCQAPTPLAIDSVSDLPAVIRHRPYNALSARDGARTFTMEELIANHLPDVFNYLYYSWTGPENGSAKKAPALD